MMVTLAWFDGVIIVALGLTGRVEDRTVRLLPKSPAPRSHRFARRVACSKGRACAPFRHYPPYGVAGGCDRPYGSGPSLSPWHRVVGQSAVIHRVTWQVRGKVVTSLGYLLFPSYRLGAGEAAGGGYLPTAPGQAGAPIWGPPGICIG